MQVADIDVAKKLVSLETSAKSRGIYFDVSFQKLKKLLEEEYCYYTGVPFDLTTNIRSIDRVDNDRGYVDDNIVASTSAFNNKKGCLTINEIKTMYGKTSEFLSYIHSIDFEDINPGKV